MRRSSRFWGASALVGSVFSVCFCLQADQAIGEEIIEGIVSVPPSSIDASNGLFVGFSSEGTLNVTSNYSVGFGNFLRVGDVFADGTLNIINGAEVVQTGSSSPVEISNGNNSGTLTVTTGGELHAPSLNLYLRSRGTINIGGEQSGPASGAGFVIVNKLVMDNGSKIIFNATNSGGNYLIGDLISNGTGAGEIYFEQGTSSLFRYNSLFSGKMFIDDGAAVHFNRTEAVGNASLDFTGGTIVADGSTTVAGDIQVINSSSVYDATFTTTSFGNFELAGDISSTGKIRFNGSGRTTVSGNNTWTGGAVVDNTELVFSSAPNLGNGAIELDTGHLTFAGTTATITNLFDLDGVSAMEVGSGGVLTASNDISGTGKLKKLGLGTLVLGGAGNSFSGGLDLTEGTLQFGAAAHIGTGTIIFYGGDLSYVSNSDATISNVIEMHNDGSLDVAAGRVLTLAGNVLNGDGGKLTIGGSGRVNFTGNNSFTGGLTIEDNSIAGFSDQAQLGTGAVQLSNGTLSYSGSTDLNFSSLGISGNGNTLLIDDSSVKTTISSSLSGSGGLTIDGGDTLTLSGSNSGWSGSFRIANTEVQFGEAANIGNGAIAITLDTGRLTYLGSSEITLSDITFNGANNYVTTSDATAVINIASDLTGSDQIFFTGPGEITANA